MNKPNIIFIVLDTLRADGILSDNKNNFLTPFIKSLLKNSYFFKNCISNAPWTVPSHISMFTGLYSTQNWLIGGEMEKLTKKVPILTEILKDEGYFTICFSENAFISQTFGFTRGFNKIFNVWDWNPWIREKYPLSTLLKLLNKFGLFFKKILKSKIFLRYWTHFQDRCEKLIRKAIKHLFLKNIIFKLKNNTLNDLEEYGQMLKKNIQNKPLYLYFNFMTTHDPYIPLKQVFKRFNISDKTFRLIRDLLINPLKTRLDIDIKSKYLSLKEIQVIRSLYDACIFSCDIIIKKLFSILTKLELLEDSIIIITSDHGEHLGGKLDHYFWEHNTYQSLYQSLIRVPLIIYSKIFKEKKIIEEQVQLKDLFHTILHMARISRLENKYFNVNKSIFIQIEKKTTPKYIYGEYINPKETMLELINSHRRTIDKKLIPKIFNHLYFIRSQNYKYIKYNNIENDEFYDLKEDPFEQNNIFDSRNEKCREMKNILINCLNKIKNQQQLMKIITSKEKSSLKKVIRDFTTNGIFTKGK